MSISQILLTEICWIVTWWLFCFLTGAATLTLLGQYLGEQNFQAPNQELSLFFSMVTGLLVQIIFLILIAQLSLLSTPVVIVGFVALLFASRKVYRSCGPVFWGAGMFMPVSRQGLMIALPLLMLVLAWSVRPLGPAVAHDEVSYHLPYARFYIQNGGLAVNEFLRFPLHTHNFNMLYVLGLMRESVSMTHLIHASAGFITLLGVHGIGRLWFGHTGALISVALLLSVGMVQQGFGNAFVDLGLMLFVTAAMFALAMWQTSRKFAWLVCTAAFLGAAMGTKYMGILFTVPLALWVFWFSRKFSVVLRFTLLTCAFGLFWYLRSWLISGNPVHPFLSDIFGYYIWSASDLENSWLDLKRQGVENSFVNFFRLPELLFSRADEFNGHSGFLGALVGGFYLGLLYWRKMPAILQPMAAISLAYLVFWFNSSQVLRYLLPVVPVMALTSVLALLETGKFIRDRLRKAGFRLQQVDEASTALFMLTFTSIFLGYQFGKDLGSVAITADDQKSYLTRNTTGYELFMAAAADQRIGAGPIMQFHHEGSLFHFPGLAVGDWVGRYAYTRFMEINAQGTWQLLPAAALREKLLELNMRGVVFQQDGSGMFYPSDLGAFERNFEFVFKNNYGMVMVPRKQPLEQPEQDPL